MGRVETNEQYDTVRGYAQGTRLEQSMPGTPDGLDAYLRIGHESQRLAVVHKILAHMTGASVRDRYRNPDSIMEDS